MIHDNKNTAVVFLNIQQATVLQFMLRLAENVPIS